MDSSEWVFDACEAGVIRVIIPGRVAVGAQTRREGDRIFAHPSRLQYGMYSTAGCDRLAGGAVAETSSTRIPSCSIAAGRRRTAAAPGPFADALCPCAAGPTRRGRL